MTSKLGCHWIRVHPDGRDLAHIEAMQYPSVKLFEWHWNNRDACRDLLSVLPTDSYILARDHPMSEQKQDMWNDPVGTGTRHANEWAMKVAMGQVHTPVERTFFLGINEPDATDGDRNAIDIYTAAFLDRLKTHGLRGGAFNFSTGHPRTIDGTGNTLADYTVFERSHQAIVNGHHIGVLHIYGTADVPCAPGHYDRLRACTWQDVKWVVGEFAIDQHVMGGGAHDGYLRALANPAQYCRWLDEAIMGINDKRIHSYQVFTYDFSHPWDSFDVRPIRDALEAYDWQHTKQVQPAPPPTSSGPTPPPEPAYVAVVAGANIRVSPLTGDVLIAAPYGAPVTMLGTLHNDPPWAHVRYQGFTGWMLASLLSATPPAPQPAPPVPPPSAPVAAGIIDPLTALAFLQVESNNVPFTDGLLTIRFEVHRFKVNLGNDALFDLHFKFTPGNYGEQYWRPTPHASWIHAHGPMAERHKLLNFAMTLNSKAALRSTGMGMAQVMGENHARIGYSNPFAMFKAFSHPRYGVNAQVMGFVNYVLSDPGLFTALRNRDWLTAVQKYNGTGQEHIYVPALEKALKQIQQEVGA